MKTNQFKETNEFGKHFYDINDLPVKEEIEVIVGDPHPVYRCVSYGGGVMFHKRTVRTVKRYKSEFSPEEGLPKYIDINCFNNGKFSVILFNLVLSDRLNTLQDAIDRAKTILAILERDQKAVFSTFGVKQCNAATI